MDYKLGYLPIGARRGAHTQAQREKRIDGKFIANKIVIIKSNNKKQTSMCWEERWNRGMFDELSRP